MACQFTRHTLAEWAEGQPYIVQQHKHGTMWIPDGPLINRSEAWRLSDYIVSSVTGGTIWFITRKDTI